jgi:hypothetical protein
MSEEVEDFLAHYGVTGMKWGRRKGGLKSRVQGAVSDSLERRATTNRAIANGQGQTRDFRRVALKRGGGLANPLMPVLTTGSKKVAAQRADTLEARKKRVDSGKMNKMDALDAVLNTHPADLLVSRRDKRALPGSPAAKTNTGKAHAAKVLAGVGGAAVIATLNTKQNRAVAGEFLKLAANEALGAAMNAKKKSNATKAYNTQRSNTHGITSHPTIRLHQNPTTGNWV